MKKNITPKKSNKLAAVRIDDAALEQVAGGRAPAKTERVTNAGVTVCCYTV